MKQPDVQPAEVTSMATGSSPEVVHSSRNRLMASGLMRREPSGETRVLPPGPAAVIERLRHELDAEHANKSRQLGLLQEEMTRLLDEQLLAASSSSRPQIDRIPTLDAALLRVLELLCNARVEAALVVPDIDLAERRAAESTMPAEVKALERGVDLRIIYPPSLLARPGLRRKVGGEVRAGAKVRATPMPAIQLLLIDRRVAVLTEHLRGGGHNSVLVRETVVVNALYRLFDAWWAQAKDAALFLADSSARPTGEVTGDERIMLRLLGEGLKDQTVAKKLGISVRTVRRRISGVLRRLPADSRFQAGVLAARRGWL
jgi:DNA-binding CsgD family transcriptional regulator